MRHLRSRQAIVLPAANIVAYSVGLLLSEIGVRSSIEEVMINPLFWVGIAVMAASAALLIVTNKYLRLCVLEILGVLTLRIVEPTVRHAWLFGVDPWWHYGLVEAIRGNNAVSIDDFLYPSKGSQVLMANAADLLQIDTLPVMRFFYIPFSVASAALLFMISLSVLRSYRFACVSVLFLAVGEGTYVSLMPETYGITLLLGVAYCTIRFLEHERFRWALGAALFSSGLLYTHYPSGFILLMTLVVFAVFMLNARSHGRHSLLAVFLICSILTSLPLLLLHDTGFRIHISNIAGNMLGALIPTVSLVAILACFGATLLILPGILSTWPRFLLATRRILDMETRPSKIIWISLILATAFFLLLSSGVVLVPAAKTAFEFMLDNIFNIVYLGLSISGILFFAFGRRAQSMSGQAFLLSWLIATGAFFIMSLYRPSLDPMRYHPIAYLPMAIFAAYAMFSLYQSGEKRVAACLLVLLALQPVFYVPPIHTPFRSGMTYEWFPEQTIRAASWISSYSAGEIVGTDLRLSNLIYGYSRGQVGASFAWAEPMNLTLVDEPAIRYGLSLGYFGFHASFPETAFSKLDSSLYQRVYDNGRAWVFSPTFRDATFMGGNDRALLCEEPREFATRPESVSSEESAASEGSLPFTIFLGAGFGFVLALTVFPLCAGRRSDSRESMKSPLRMREFGSASQS